MRIGRNMRKVIQQLERLGAEFGRPPCLSELKQSIPEMRPADVSKSLTGLERYGFVENVGHGHYVLRKALDGRVVTFAQHVGLMN